MTEPDRKFEEEIRRALYAASDLIVPAGDGLNKIRERAARRPPAVGWLLACAVHLPRQLAHGGRVAASEVAATTHGYSSLGLVLREGASRAADAERMAAAGAGHRDRPAPRDRGHALDSQAAQSGGCAAGQRLRQQPPQPRSHRDWPRRPPGSAQSTKATPIPSRTMAGKPFLATMPPPGAQCRAHETGGIAARYVAPPLAPAVGQTAGAGTNGVATNSATCSSATSPSKVNTSSSLPALPATDLVTQPPTTTTPVTTPPTTPPRPRSRRRPRPRSRRRPRRRSRRPVTTPPTTTSPASSTSSADSTDHRPPTQTPTPGG